MSVGLVGMVTTVRPHVPAGRLASAATASVGVRTEPSVTRLTAAVTAPRGTQGRAARGVATFC